LIGKDEKSAEAIVATGNEPRLKAGRTHRVAKGRTLGCLKFDKEVQT